SETRSGLPLRFVDAISSSSFLLIDSYMLLDAPLSSLFLVSPRLAARAAPAAICCALDFAGMGCLLLSVWPPPNARGCPKVRRHPASRPEVSSSAQTSRRR